MRTRLLLVISTLLFGASSIFAVPVSFQANDDTITTTLVRGPYTLANLTDNDTSSGGPVFILAASKPEHGNAEVRPGNVVVYTTSHSFRGTDAFTYTIGSDLNGIGAISQASVTIRNPYYLYRGTYNSAIAGIHQIHSESGYLTLTVDPLGSFSAKVFFAGQAYPFKAEFDAEGRYTANIQRAAPLPSLRLDMQFHLEGEPGIDCNLTIGAQLTTFVAQYNTWSSLNRPPLEGKYTITLPAPDTRSTTPQGSGYGVLVISRSGTATFRGRTGDNRSYSASSILGVDNTVPFYSALYDGTGSIFGDVVFNEVTTGSVLVNASLIWTKQRKPKDKLFPKGFIRTVAAHGSNYIEPTSNTCVLDVGETENFNSNFTVTTGVLQKTRTERALLANRPDVGIYAVTFDNTKHLQASLKVSPSDGVFRGTFFNAITQKYYKMSGVFVQGENAAYGLWNSSTKAGFVLLQPDSLSAN